MIKVEMPDGKTYSAEEPPTKTRTRTDIARELDAADLDVALRTAALETAKGNRRALNRELKNFGVKSRKKGGA